MTATDPKQKMAGIILCLEMYAIADVQAIFGETYADSVDDKTLDLTDFFFSKYSERLKNYNDMLDKNIAEAQKKLEALMNELNQKKDDLNQNKRDIAENDKNIASMMDKFSVQQVESNE